MEKSSAEQGFVETIVNARYAETDQMGVVYYANYLVWFEVGRVAWCRENGFRYRDMELEDDRYFMVAEATCRYKAPARFEDDILIRTTIGSATDKVIRFQYELRNKESDQLLATGETAHVIADPEFKPARLPDRYRKNFGLPPRRSGRE
jgi:acyl-CoA thioester hydrolase